MPVFPDERFPVPVRADLLDAMRGAWERLSGPGASFTAERRLALVAVARRAHAECHAPPWARRPPPDGAAEQVAHEVASGAHRIDRDWAGDRIAELGEAAYVEVVATAATVVAIDVFAEALGVGKEPLPAPQDGEPTGSHAAEVDDIGAHVRVAAAPGGANVGRALTLVPDAARLFFGVEPAFYAAGEQFQQLVWDRALTRPQVELVAARTSAINECFY